MVVVFYLKERCLCGGMVAVGSFCDLATNQIMVGGGVCQECFRIVKLPDMPYVEFVAKYCEEVPEVDDLKCQECGGKVHFSHKVELEIFDQGYITANCDECGTVNIFPVEDYWPLFVDKKIDIVRR